MLFKTRAEKWTKGGRESWMIHLDREGRVAETVAETYDNYSHGITQVPLIAC